jgi:hypothetical protein
MDRLETDFTARRDKQIYQNASLYDLIMKVTTKPVSRGDGDSHLTSNAS